MTTTEINPDLSDQSRCISVHWSLPVQCVLPRTHRRNWHEAWDPETGNRLRYRRTFGTYATEELRNNEWTALFISPPSDMVEVDRADLERLREENARVVKLHKPYKIYDECCHQHKETDEGVTDVEDIGLTCEDGFMYEICSHCCTNGYGDQTETCATEHDHSMHICETRAVLAGEDWVKRPAKAGV